ncbi:MAG: phage holin family protein [Verrucomicrobiota bacterium]
METEVSRPSRMKVFLLRWAVNTLGVVVAANVVKGISYDTTAGLLIASLLLGIMNAILRPLLVLLVLPLVVVTLGLFYFVINGLLLYSIGWLVGSFHVAGFGAAFWGALVISLVSTIVGALTGLNRMERAVPKVSFKANLRSSQNSNRGDDGGGPVIDV